VKTAVYIRQSLDRDMNKVSVDYQREQLLTRCRDRLGCLDAVEGLDRNVSSKAGTSRPAFNELCEDIRNGVLGTVAVWHQDRLTRVPSEIEQFLDLADEYHVALANVSGRVALGADQTTLRAVGLRLSRPSICRPPGRPVPATGLGPTDASGRESLTVPTFAVSGERCCAGPAARPQCRQGRRQRRRAVCMTVTT